MLQYLNKILSNLPGALLGAAFLHELLSPPYV
jgi:hypothetical protein